MEINISFFIVINIFFGLCYLFCIFAFFGIGGSLMRGYAFLYTNRTNNNKKQQKYLLKFYAIKSFVLTAVIHSMGMCFIFKCNIAAWVFTSLIIPIWFLFYFISKKNKKLNNVMEELSAEKEYENYIKNLENLNNESDENTSNTKEK